VSSRKADSGSFADAYLSHVGCLREHSRALIRPEWGSIHSVSDLLHEVYLRAQARWEKFQGAKNCSVEVWLTGQLIDTVRDLNRRYLAAKRQAEAEVFISRLASLLAGNETDPRDAAAREELAERLSLAMANLKPPVRDLLIRIYYNEELPEQIAADLQITTGNFRVRQSRALGKLRESWDELFGEEDCA
jgi:RNA polymerase sigma factor (sigma-70 family)